jgi:hypothetical protein
MARCVKRNGIVWVMTTRGSQTILKVQVITLPTWKWMLNRKRDFTYQGCLVKNVTMLSKLSKRKGTSIH